MFPTASPLIALQSSSSTITSVPQAPDWQLDWQGWLDRSPWLQAMDGVPQEPIYHAEGNVLIHTKMVTETLIELPEWRALPGIERHLLFLSALLHDVGKPACTTTRENGRITSQGHARKGEHIARRLLWLGEEGLPQLPLYQREYIAVLVRLHGLPLQFLDKPQPERLAIAASQHIRLDHLALLSEADVRGRICADQKELLTRIDLFREFCQEQQCYTQPYSFANDHSRFEFFRHPQRDPNYAAYDDTSFEIVMLSGLPGVGKDTWIKIHLKDWPVISLDTIRQELKIAPTEGQGPVIQAAKERARQYMRQKQRFVWNATNITRSLREPLIDFFVGYGARVRLVYLDIPATTLLERNANRSAYVPEHIISRLLNKLEVPDLTEAHKVEWITTA